MKDFTGGVVQYIRYICNLFACFLVNMQIPKFNNQHSCTHVNNTKPQKTIISLLLRPQSMPRQHGSTSVARQQTAAAPEP